MTIKELTKYLKELDEIASDAEDLKFSAKEVFREFLREDGRLNGLAIREEAKKLNDAVAYSDEYRKMIVHYEEKYNQLEDLLVREDISPVMIGEILGKYGVYERFYGEN